MEMHMINGKHRCGKNMDFKIKSVKNDKIVFAWLIYGICKKCKVVLASAIISQSERPIEGIDFIINYNLIAEEGEKI